MDDAKKRKNIEQPTADAPISYISFGISFMNSKVQPVLVHDVCAQHTYDDDCFDDDDDAKCVYDVRIYSNTNDNKKTGWTKSNVCTFVSIKNINLLPLWKTGPQSGNIFLFHSHPSILLRFIHYFFLYLLVVVVIRLTW